MTISTRIKISSLERKYKKMWISMKIHWGNLLINVLFCSHVIKNYAHNPIISQKFLHWAYTCLIWWWRWMKAKWYSLHTDSYCLSLFTYKYTRHASIIINFYKLFLKLFYFIILLLFMSFFFLCVWKAWDICMWNLMRGRRNFNFNKIHLFAFPSYEHIKGSFTYCLTLAERGPKFF